MILFSFLEAIIVFVAVVVRDLLDVNTDNNFASFDFKNFGLNFSFVMSIKLSKCFTNTLAILIKELYPSNNVLVIVDFNTPDNLQFAKL